MSALRFSIFCALLAATTIWLPAQAQAQERARGSVRRGSASVQLPAGQAPVRLLRSERTIVRSGLLVKRDSNSIRRDSLIDAAFVREIDSLLAEAYAADSTAIASLRTDDAHAADSLYRLRMEGVIVEADTTARKKGWFMSDSMSLSKVAWLSTVLPGYGQVYNKQYWKLPVLYGLVGGGIALYLHEQKTFRPLKREYEAYTRLNTSRTPELDALQARMRRSNTRRQLYLGAAIASYIYFIGDAAVNYSTNDVSSVKKATTLSCIFPGAGQIYNKSYWKVPFVVGGFATMIYVIDWNNRAYQRYKKAYSLRSDYELHPEKYPNGATDEFRNRSDVTSQYLRDVRNSARRNRDLCIILTGALYVFQIVDAHVDAHLRDYDISDDLTMNLEPMVNYTYIPAAGGDRAVFGFNLSVKF